MDIRRLRYFAQVVEARSLTRAADQLHVAQPALTKSIQSLEQDLEAPLLFRSSQGVTPTEAGERLYEHCQIIFQQLDRARMDVRRTGSRPSGHVVVGLPYSILAAVGLPLILAAAERLPEVRMEISQDQSHQLSGRIRANRVDFAIMASPRSQADLLVEPLLSEELFLVEPGDGSTPITFAEAAQRRFILPGAANGLRATIESHFRARSLSLTVVHELDAIALIPRCVAAGLGATILPGGCLSDPGLLGAFAIRRLDAGCHRAIVLCRSASRALSPAAEALIGPAADLCRDLAIAGTWRGAGVSGGTWIRPAAAKAPS